MLQKKWKHIRDRYARELSERKGKSGQGGKIKAPYMYAQQLSFLSNVIKSRTTDSSLDETEQTPTRHESLPPDHPVVQGGGHSVGKKRRANTVETKLIEALESHSERQKKKDSEKEDDDRLFLLSLLPTIKSIPAHFKLAVRMDLMQCINKYIALPQSAQTSQQPVQPRSHSLTANITHSSHLSEPIQPGPYTPNYNATVSQVAQPSQPPIQTIPYFPPAQFSQTPSQQKFKQKPLLYGPQSGSSRVQETEFNEPFETEQSTPNIQVESPILSSSTESMHSQDESEIISLF